jgi:hypothetical protein
MPISARSMALLDCGTDMIPLAVRMGADDLLPLSVAGTLLNPDW